MGLSDSRPASAHGYVFPPAVGRVSTPLRRVSQFPQRIFLCALSPTTPESPVAYGPSFHHTWQASPSLPGWPSFHLRHEAEPSSLHYGSQVRLPRLRQADYSRSTLVRLHVERVIHMVDSFHSTRFASLLTHPRRKATQRKHRGFFSCALCGTFSGEAAARPSGENLLLGPPSPMNSYRQVYSVDCLALIFGNWPLVCT